MNRRLAIFLGPALIATTLPNRALAILEPDSMATTSVQPQGIVSWSSVPSSTMNISWEGVKSDLSIAPPDPHGGVGPNGIVAIVNAKITYFSRNGWAMWGPIPTPQFFQPAGNQGKGVDGKAVYDAGSQRFYVILQENYPTNSYLNLAVSKTSHPTTSTTLDWWLYRIAITSYEGSNAYLMDYPQIGFDSRAVFVTANMYPAPLVQPFRRSQVLVFPKSQFGQAALSPTRRFGQLSISGGFTLQPAIVTGGDPGNYAYFAETVYTQADKVRVWAFSYSDSSFTGSPLFTVPNHGGGATGPHAPQCQTSLKINPLFLRTQNHAIWHSGALWFCHTAGLSSGRSIVYYYKIWTNGFPASSLSLGESGGIDGGASNWNYMPSLGGNALGTIGLTYTQSSGSVCPRMMFTSRLSGDSNFGPSIVLKQSTTFVSNSVWGDYGAVMPDPLDNSLWAVHQFSKDNYDVKDWSTLWANVTTSSCAFCGDPQMAYETCGKWEAIPSENWPDGITAVHMVLTRVGKVLMWGRTSAVARAYHWDPVTSIGVPVVPTHIDTTYMGSGHVVLGDGRVLIVGGEYSPYQPPPNGPVGITKTTLFDPQATCATECSWLPGPVLSQGRWHPAATVLPDARILAVSGWREVSLLAQLPEIYSGSWATVSSASKNDLSLSPFMFLDPSPNGIRVVYLGPGSAANAIEPPLGVLQPAQRIGDLALGGPAWSTVGSYSVRGGASAVYAKGQVLKSGGTPVGGGAASKQSESITFNLSSGTLQALLEGDMCSPRAEHQLVVMANGSVLAVGGSTLEERANDQYFKGVYQTEIWEAGLGWKAAAPMNHRFPATPRMYHSGALLLPDGRVLVAGGQCLDDFGRCPGFPDQFCANGDFYSPPYLFKAGNVAIADVDRPSVQGLPPLSLVYGEALSVSRSVGSGASSVVKVALMRPGATTRSDDMEQRYVPLNFSDGGTLTVTGANMPTTRLAPPGYYMLFLVNNLGRPSKAPFVSLWQVVDTSVSTSGLTINPDGTFDIDFTWKTTDKASEGDNLIIVSAPPGGDPVPTSQWGSISTDGLTHTWHIRGWCWGGTWTYQVRSRRAKYTTGDGQSISTSASKTFKITACLVP